MGRRAVAVATDVADPNACEHLAQSAIDELGRIDVLLNNAGVGHREVSATHETPEEFTRVIDVNLTGCFQMAASCARRMEHGGSIINVSSIIALTTAGLPQAAYSASKAALLGMTRDLAQQWTGRKGIRVNAICPGFFPTEMTDGYMPGYLEKMMEQRVVMGRAGRPEEFAATAVFLAAPASGYMTGATVVVDGGVTIT